MATSKSKAVATTSKKTPATAKNTDDSLPDFMKDDAGRGSENISNDDIGIPRLKLIQGTSQKELEAYNVLRPGMFFHSAAEFPFEDGIIRAVPIFFSKRYLLWRPLEDGGGILARADDAVHWQPADAEFNVKLDKKDGGARVTWKTAKTVKESGLADWGTMNPSDPDSPPAANLMYEYVLGFPDHPDLPPAVLTFQRSSIKNAKNGINDRLKIGKAPIFGRIFEFRAVDDVNSAGQKFYNIQPRAAGLLGDADIYEDYKRMHEAFAESGLQVQDEEELQEEAKAYEGGDGDGKY